MLLILVVKLKQVLFHSFNRNIHHVQTCCWGLARKITSTQLGILHVVSFNSEQLVCTVVSYLILPCCALPKGCVVLGCLIPLGLTGHSPIVASRWESYNELQKEKSSSTRWRGGGGDLPTEGSGKRLVAFDKHLYYCQIKRHWCAHQCLFVRFKFFYS